MSHEAAMAILDDPTQVDQRILEAKKILAKANINKAVSFASDVTEMKRDISLINQAAQRMEDGLSALHASTAELNAASKEVTGSVAAVATTIKDAVVTKITEIKADAAEIKGNTSTEAAMRIGLKAGFISGGITGVLTGLLTGIATTAAAPWITAHLAVTSPKPDQTAACAPAATISMVGAAEPPSLKYARISLDGNIPQITINQSLVVLPVVDYGAHKLVRPIHHSHRSKHGRHHQAHK